MENIYLLLNILFFFSVKGFYPKWTSDKITAPASEWAVSEMNVSVFNELGLGKTLLKKHVDIDSSTQKTYGQSSCFTVLGCLGQLQCYPQTVSQFLIPFYLSLSSSLLSKKKNTFISPSHNKMRIMSTLISTEQRSIKSEHLLFIK